MKSRQKHAAIMVVGNHVDLGANGSFCAFCKRRASQKNSITHSRLCLVGISAELLSDNGIKGYKVDSIGEKVC